MNKISYKVIADSLRRFRVHSFVSISTLALIAIIYLTIDYRGPKEIYLQPDNAFGFPCLRARDLIVQEYDKKNNLWATRGMLIYRLKNGDNKFARVAHVPTGFSIFWLRNFTFIRRLTLRPECIEIIVSNTEEICALSAGRIWHRAAGGKKFDETIILSHYGFGDQGIRNDGIVRTNDSTIFYGEYFKNPERAKVRIYMSKDNGRSWKVAYEFQPGQIRHIHALQKDPYSEKLWLCAGDKDEEAIVAWSVDGYNTIIPIGQGSQIWRVCQLIFTEEAVYWGSDTGLEDASGIYRWNRKSKEFNKLQQVDGAVFFGTRLAKGTIIMSTDREGMRNEKDDRTRIFIMTKDNKITTIVCGTWKSKKHGFWFKFAMLRFQRNQNGPSLVITCLNQKEFPDGDLIIISEDALLKAVGSNHDVEKHSNHN